MGVVLLGGDVDLGGRRRLLNGSGDGRLDNVSGGEPEVSEADLRSFLEAAGRAQNGA